MCTKLNNTAALVAVIIGSLLGAGCGDEGSQPEPSFVSNGESKICSTCAALTATPTAGVVECKGACKKVPAPGDSFKCATVNGQEKCVPAGEADRTTSPVRLSQFAASRPAINPPVATRRPVLQTYAPLRPIFLATIGAAIVLDEVVTFRSLGAALLILGGVALALRRVPAART